MKMIDITGEKFGELTVIKRTENNKEGRAMWDCECSCGEHRIVMGKNLRNGKITKCLKCSRKGNNMIDLTGQRFGRLMALEPTNERRDTSVIWKCQCDCGNICYKASQDLRQGKTQSCGCLQQEARYIPNQDLTGQKFGRLTVIKQANESNHEGTLWLCECECGGIKIASSYALTHGRVQSCGCLNSIMNSKIAQLLTELNINYIKEKIFNDCKDNKNLRFDFYLPDDNICIEYDGEQHFNAVKYWGGQEGLKNRQYKDEIKNQYCKNNNISLIRLNYLEKDKINKEYLFDIIKDIKNFKEK